MRKISSDRQRKLDRIHVRDCPGQYDFEVDCLECMDIRNRRKEAEARYLAFIKDKSDLEGSVFAVGDPILGMTKYVAFIEDTHDQAYDEMAATAKEAQAETCPKCPHAMSRHYYDDGLGKVEPGPEHWLVCLGDDEKACYCATEPTC